MCCWPQSDSYICGQWEWGSPGWQDPWAWAFPRKGLFYSEFQIAWLKRARRKFKFSWETLPGKKLYIWWLVKIKDLRIKYTGRKSMVVKKQEGGEERGLKWKGRKEKVELKGERRKFTFKCLLECVCAARGTGSLVGKEWIIFFEKQKCKN